MVDESKSLLTRLGEKQDIDEYRELHWEGGFEDYLDKIKSNPGIFRNAFQYLRDMIKSYGCEQYTLYRQDLLHYHFFDDPFDKGRDAVYGLDKPLMDLVGIFDSAANRYGTDRRIILLHGPVGTAKSTIVRLFKKGLEAYSRTESGQVYTFVWYPESPDLDSMPCPMHEDPLRLIPHELREAAREELGLAEPIVGDLCPACQYIFDQLLEQSGGDWLKVVTQVRVKRLLFSEKKRVGIGTFQPRDEKNQDSTELTGDINFRKIAIYGSEADPRAFDFSGELNIANRGMIEFIEILKLDVAFLYDLLTASQEHKIKPKKFAHTDIDEVIISHTNREEYERLRQNQYMKAFCDRTVKVDIPYNLQWSNETRIYERDYNQERVKDRHIAPHTMRIAALWAVLTRLEDPKRAGLSVIQKAKLYDGQSLPGYTEDSVIELRTEHPAEGMDGVSPRYIQDMMANVLVSPECRGCVNPFMLLRELENGLTQHSLINDDKQRKRYQELLSLVQTEYDEILKNEVQRAMIGDDDALARLCSAYIDNIKAYTSKTKVRDPITRKDVEPNEKLMRSIEEKIEIPESRKEDFRREIMNYIAVMAIDGKTFTWKSNERLCRALELKLFEDQKDTIKLTVLVSEVVDKEMQEKIEVVKTRMINDLGYCDVCATDVLNYVASIFARGDAKK